MPTIVENTIGRVVHPYIYILKNTVYEATYLNQFCNEKVFEICPLKMKIKSAHLLVLRVYGSPSGDFSYFLTQLERVLNKLYNITTSIILQGRFSGKPEKLY